MADSHGMYVASTSGCTSASDGVHHPSQRDATRYSATSYAKKIATSRYAPTVRPSTARDAPAAGTHARHNWGCCGKARLDRLSAAMKDGEKTTATAPPPAVRAVACCTRKVVVDSAVS